VSEATKTTYNLLEIAIPGATNTYATDLNDRGEIVGYTGPPGSRQSQGFVYAQDTFNVLPVPVLPVPLAINNAGEVVGGYTGPDGDDAAFLYQGGAVSELFSLQGFFGADAFLGVAGLNDNGVIAGNIYAQNNDRGFIYDHGISRSLRDDLRAAFPTNPPGMDITGDFRAITTGINNQGEAIGIYRAVPGDSDNSPRFGLVDYNGAVTLLQVPGTTNTDAFGINDAGKIVGGSDVGAFIYENGAYTILNDPEAATGTTVAKDVNDQGDIIGDYKNAAGISHGFVYRDGTYTTLDAPGAISTTLSDINSTGEIVGNYTATDGTHHAFLAMPTVIAGTRQNGGNGRDNLVGNAGNDVLNGGNGPDTLDGLGGNDILTGGNGPDNFIIRNGNGQDHITDFRGVDTVVLPAGNAALDSFTEVLAAITDTASGALLNLGGGNTVLFEGVTKASLAANDFAFIA
jgi:probable HAF family extracellular repeat protein